MDPSVPFTALRLIAVAVSEPQRWPPMDHATISTAHHATRPWITPIPCPLPRRRPWWKRERRDQSALSHAGSGHAFGRRNAMKYLRPPLWRPWSITSSLWLRFFYNIYFSIYFLVRNGIFLPQQINRNNILTFFSAKRTSLSTHKFLFHARLCW